MFGLEDGIKKRVSESHIHIGAAGCSPGFYTKTAPHTKSHRLFWPVFFIFINQKNSHQFVTGLIIYQQPGQGYNQDNKK